MNDMFDIGVNDNMLNLINECDKEAKVAIKTPFGLTERVSVHNTVAQGDVNSTVKCTVTVSDVSEKHEENLGEHIYKYKDFVPIPPLGMVDDIANISRCGIDSVLAAAHLNSQTNLKNLQFGKLKCVQMHVGNKSAICPDNFIDTWTLQSKNQKITSVWELEDVESDQHCMKKVTEWKYLGDVINSNAKCDSNIKDRAGKGSGAADQIIQMLSDLCLGKYYFQSAVILRTSLFLATLLSNAETWVNISPKNISDLENIDEQLLRDLLSAHRKTPKETLYLETGSIPVRFVIIARRINFLHYILCEDKNSLISRFFKAQCAEPIKGDWASTVMKDLDFFNIKLSFDEIARYSKSAFVSLVKDSVKKKAFSELVKQQKDHSKGKEIVYRELCLQKYLGATSPLNKEEKQFLFAARTRGLDLKNNFKQGKQDLMCRLCQGHIEDQQNLLTCSVLNNVKAPVQADYRDIFSDRMDKLLVITKLLKAKFEEFNFHVNRQPSRSAADIVVNVDNIVNIDNHAEMD